MAIPHRLQIDDEGNRAKLCMYYVIAQGCCCGSADPDEARWQAVGCFRCGVSPVSSVCPAEKPLDGGGGVPLTQASGRYTGPLPAQPRGYGPPTGQCLTLHRPAPSTAPRLWSANRSVSDATQARSQHSPAAMVRQQVSV